MWVPWDMRDGCCAQRPEKHPREEMPLPWQRSKSLTIAPSGWLQAGKTGACFAQCQASEGNEFPLKCHEASSSPCWESDASMPKPHILAIKVLSPLQPIWRHFDLEDICIYFPHKAKKTVLRSHFAALGLQYLFWGLSVLLTQPWPGDWNMAIRNAHANTTRNPQKLFCNLKTIPKWGASLNVHHFSLFFFFKKFIFLESYYPQVL